MDSFEDLSAEGCDSSSSKTIVLWKNKIPFIEGNATFAPTSGTGFQLDENVHKIPRGLSENYLNTVTKVADDLIDNVIAHSVLVIQQCKKNYKTNFSNPNNETENEMAIKKCIEKCKDSLSLMSVSDQSLFSASTWLNNDGTMDDQAAMVKIADYINKNWNLEEKYLFTIEKTNSSIISGVTCNHYEVQFSVPTKEHPIPRITVSAFFVIEITPSTSFPVYIRYQLETDRRVYVVGKHSFNKNRFEHLFKIKQDAYADINEYAGWSL